MVRLRYLFRWALAAALVVGTVLPAGEAAGAAAPAQERRLRRVPAATPVEAGAAPVSQVQQAIQVLIQLRQDPVARVYARALQQGRTPSAAEQRAHRSLLTAAQDRVLAEVTAAGGRLVYRFQNVLNGLLVRVPAAALPDLAGLPEVKAIYTARPVHRDNESSVPFVGAQAVWNLVDAQGNPVTGRGIRVAVIDTGIDYYHAALGGSGDPRDYAADDPTVREPGTFPTAKVVDGWDLAGDDYDAGTPGKDIPRPDPDPLDPDGHGTHVAATIGGIGVPGTLGPGVAPDVLLYAYKVFGRDGSTNLTDAAIEMAMDPNGDGDLSDHVDIINMSLGSPFGEEIEAEIAQNAADVGVIVVASAGNNGDVPYITGSPAVAPGAISVAAAADDGIVHGAVEVQYADGTKVLYEATEAAFTPPLSETGDVTGDLVDTGGRGCVDGDFKADPAGKIALVDRGTCTFAEKVLNAQNRGAIGVVVVNNVDGDPITMGGDPTGITIPAVMITKAGGADIRQALNGGQTATVTLSARFTIPRPDLADTLASFTSRGPGGARSSFKPDLAAPGVDIRSAAAGTGAEGVLLSGTSMAAPHVAGAAALLRQLHPDWKVDEIKAALQNTTTPARDQTGAPYPLTRQGTGRIRVDRAAKATVLALPGGISFGHIPVVGTVEVTRTVTVRNKGATARTFALSVALSGDDAGVTADLSSSQVTVPAGGEAAFDLTLTFDPDGLPDQMSEPFVERGGWIRLEEQGGEGEELVVGFTAFPERSAQVTGSVTAVTDQSAHVKLENAAAVPGWAAPFYLVTVDGQDALMRGYPAADARYVGIRVGTDPYDGSDVLELAIVTQAPWGADEPVTKAVYLDSDQDGTYDYYIFTDNLRNYGFSFNWGATFVYDLKADELEVFYTTPDSTWYNASATIMAVPMGAVGLAPGQPFTITALTVAGGGAAFDIMPTIPISGDLTRAPLPDLTVQPGSPATLAWADPSRSLLVLYPDNAPAAQSQVFTFPPGGLRASNRDGAVELMWNRSPEGWVVGYLVYRSGDGVNWQPIATVPQPAAGGQVRFTDSGLINETDYTYRVYALTAAGHQSGMAAEVTAHPSAAPGQPTGFKGTAGRSGSRYEVKLTWMANAEADLGGYHVYRRDPKTGAWSQVAAVARDATTWSDTVTTTGTYTYGLVAVDVWDVPSAMATTTVTVRPPAGGGGGGSPAPELPPAPKEPPAGPPDGVQARAEDGKVTLTWNAVAGATQYRIYWGTGPVQPTQWQELATVTGTGFTWMGLTNGVTYWFKIVAVNALGTSADSAAVWALPLKAGAEPGTYPHSHAAVGYSGGWVTIPAGGKATQAVSNTALGAATIAFRGAGITWLAEAGPNRGIALVYLDGVLAAVVDLYRPEATSQYVAYEIKGLAPGTHSLTVVVTGLKRAEATSAYVSVEGFVVHPEEPPAGPPGGK